MRPVRFISLLLLAAPALAHAERVKVAIVPEVEVNLDQTRADMLAQDLADALESELDVDATGGLVVRRALPPDGLPSDCRATPACVADLAKRLDATQLLFVVMADTSGLQVDSTWVDVATNKQVVRPPVVVGPISEAKARFVASARTLLPDAPQKPKPKVDAAPPPTNGVSTTTRAAVPRHFTTGAKITAGAAVVGAGVGIYFGLRAKNDYRDCNVSPIDCSSDERDSIRRTALIADAGFFVAAAGAIATSILFATSGKEAQVVVEPSPTGVALTAVGRF